MFDILLESEKYIEEMNEKVVSAKIIINDFSEIIYIPISYWNINNYLDSWKISLQEGVLNKKNSVLLTSVYNLKYANFIQSWVLYYSEQKIYIQNKIFFLSEYKGINFKNINNFVLERETLSEDGEKVSEWECEFSDILNFYNKLTKINESKGTENNDI